jgi:hypothetical protein
LSDPSLSFLESVGSLFLGGLQKTKYGNCPQQTPKLEGYQVCGKEASTGSTDGQCTDLELILNYGFVMGCQTSLETSLSPFH